MTEWLGWASQGHEMKYECLIRSWWNRIMDGDYKLQALGDTDTLFGIKTSNVYIGLLNQIILLTKMFLHDSNLSSDHNVSLFVFLVTLKQQANIQTEICKSNIA